MTKCLSERPAFQKIEMEAGADCSADHDQNLDRRLDQKARQKGIPSLVIPANEKAAPSLPAAPRTPTKTLNIELPDYLWIELKKRAAGQMISLRHLIMTLLRDNGYEIDERDMIEDGRRLREKNQI
jgi:hypothetical protein